MQVLSAKELLYMGLAILLTAIVFYWVGYFNKTCDMSSITEVQTKNKKLDEQLKNTESQINSLKESYAAELGINESLEETNSGLIEQLKKPIEPIIKWIEKPVYIKADDCEGVLGTNKQKTFNDTTRKLENKMIP